MPTPQPSTHQNWDAQSLEKRKHELMSTIDMVVDFLAPNYDRRTGQARRSGRERRDARSDALYADRRSGRDRRESSDRRMPPPERLRLLRLELEQIIQLQESLANPS